MFSFKFCIHECFMLSFRFTHVFITLLLYVFCLLCPPIWDIFPSTWNKYPESPYFSWWPLSSDLCLPYPFFKKKFTGYKFWVSKYFSCSLLKISCHSLWFSCCPASNSVDVIGLFLWHLLRFSLPSMFCSFTVCLVWISFYLIHLEIYKLLNLWIGIFHHSGKSSVIVSIFGISAPILPLLLVEHLLIINRC